MSESDKFPTIYYYPENHWHKGNEVLLEKNEKSKKDAEPFIEIFITERKERLSGYYENQLYWKRKFLECSTLEKEGLIMQLEKVKNDIEAVNKNIEAYESDCLEIEAKLNELGVTSPVNKNQRYSDGVGQIPTSDHKIR